MRHALLLVAVAAAVCLPLAAAAATPPPGMDFLMSTVMQERQSSISGLAIRGRLHSAALLDNVTILPTLEWWRSSSHVDPYSIESVRSDKTLTLDARYEFNSKGVQPYIGGGLAAHFISSKVNAPSLGVYNAEKSLTKGGFDVLGGMTFPLTSKLQNFLELKYLYVTDYNQLKLNWGISVTM